MHATFALHALHRFVAWELIINSKYNLVAPGMHYALQIGAPWASVVGAFEVHNIANDVYEHNFGWRPTQVPPCHLSVTFPKYDIVPLRNTHAAVFLCKKQQGDLYTPRFCDAVRVLLQINLEGITTGALDSFRADIWLMSPPCQPFTRRGLQLHAADRRSASFVHLLEILPSLKVNSNQTA